MLREISVAIMGLDDLTTNLLKLIHAARKGDIRGVPFEDMGGYRIADIRIVEIADPALRGAPLARVLPAELADIVESDKVKDKADGADILVFIRPQGLGRRCAAAAASAGGGFINASPEHIAKDPRMRELFKDSGALLVGDRLRDPFDPAELAEWIAQGLLLFGISIESLRVLRLSAGWGSRLMLAPMLSRRFTICEAVAERDAGVMVVETKDARLEVLVSGKDGLGRAKILADAIRAVKLAQERGLRGYLPEVSAYACSDSNPRATWIVAFRLFEKFLSSISSGSAQEP